MPANRLEFVEAILDHLDCRRTLILDWFGCYVSKRSNGEDAGTCEAQMPLSRVGVRGFERNSDHGRIAIALTAAIHTAEMQMRANGFSPIVGLTF